LTFWRELCVAAISASSVYFDMDLYVAVCCLCKTLTTRVHVWHTATGSAKTSTEVVCILLCMFWKVVAGLPAPAARKVCVDNTVVRGAACCLRQARQGLHASVGCELSALMAAKTMLVCLTT
jgi:hypothetical protein